MGQRRSQNGLSSEPPARLDSEKKSLAPNPGIPIAPTSAVTLDLNKDGIAERPIVSLFLFVLNFIVIRSRFFAGLEGEIL
jgi:hypothetical protein